MSGPRVRRLRAFGRETFPDAPRPLVFAHRGLSSEAPENTMAAFRLARGRGVPGIELDVHLSADGQVVVFHDHGTGRIGRNGGGVTFPDLVVENTNWEELSAVDIGSWKGEAWMGERIPLLADLLEELGPAMWWDIELKNRTMADYGLEAAVSKVIRGTSHGPALAARCAVSSFNPWSLARFRALDPTVPVGVIWANDGGIPAFLRHGEGRWIGHADFVKPRSDLARKTSAFRWRILEGYEFFPWTVDDPVEAARLVGLGAAGIISNRADQVMPTGAAGLPGL